MKKSILAVLFTIAVYVPAFADGWINPVYGGLFLNGIGPTSSFGVGVEAHAGFGNFDEDNLIGFAIYGDVGFGLGIPLEDIKIKFSGNNGTELREVGGGGLFIGPLLELYFGQVFGLLFGLGYHMEFSLDSDAIGGVYYQGGVSLMMDDLKLSFTGVAFTFDEPKLVFKDDPGKTVTDRFGLRIALLWFLGDM
jgi:hypothetical protein